MSWEDFCKQKANPAFLAVINSIEMDSDGVVVPTGDSAVTNVQDEMMQYLEFRENAIVLSEEQLLERLRGSSPKMKKLPDHMKSIATVHKKNISPTPGPDGLPMVISETHYCFQDEDNEEIKASLVTLTGVSLKKRIFEGEQLVKGQSDAIFQKIWEDQLGENKSPSFIKGLQN